ncbi:hypothetical protein [Nocardia vaccinii]|uniref:hypothetical protein n=1 Tax=Nocardia vaccinii TaxID=1822 RepID=UPI00083254B2|nr:hypothetical protein [Nocardia vaccinii]
MNVTVQVLLDGTSNPLPYTYGGAVPTLTSINPASGSAAGGATVVLTYIAVPTLTGVTPNSGPPSGGTVVVLITDPGPETTATGVSP